MESSFEGPHGQAVRLCADLQDGGEMRSDRITGKAVRLAELLVAEPNSIDQTQAGAGVHEAARLDGCPEGHHPVHLTLFVQDGDVPVNAWEGVVGLLVCEGKNFVVEGQRVYAIDEFCAQGLSPLGYAAKYVFKRAAPMSLSEGTASAQRLNRELPALQSDLEGRN